MDNLLLEFLEERLITQMNNGEISRDSLSNHGELFEGEGEEIAIRRFKNYLDSGFYLNNKLLEENDT